MRTANAVPVTGDGVVSDHSVTLLGLSVRNGTGSANTVALYDHASAASGTLVLVLDVPATVGNATYSIPGGIRCTNGLYLDSTGAITGSVWVG